jgi:hypothetical protein
MPLNSRNEGSNARDDVAINVCVTAWAYLEQRAEQRALTRGVVIVVAAGLHLLLRMPGVH